MHEHALTGIIQLTTLDTPPKGAVLVELNSDGKAVRRGRLASLAARLPIGGRSYRYLIHTDRSVEIYDAHRVFKTFIVNETTEVRFRVQVVARHANAERIAESLHHASLSPADILMNAIESALRAEVDRDVEKGPDSVANRIATQREAWQATIAARLADRFGLDATVIFEGGYRSITRDIALVNYPVTPRDAPHRTVNLTIHVRLTPTNERARDAFPATPTAQESLLRGIVEDVVRGGLTLYDVWFEPQAVVRALRDRVDLICRAYAYRAEEVVVQPVRAVPARKEHHSVKIDWTGHRGRTIVFDVDANLLMRADGGGLYDSQSQPDRRAWLIETAGKALKAAMHGRDVFDLSKVEQARVEERVRAILREEGLRIGHDIDPLVAEVRLPENRWLDRQTLVIVPTEPFKMKNEVANAEFGITLDLKFTTLRPLVAYVEQQGAVGSRAVGDYSVLIEEQITALVLRVVQIVMRQVEASDYYSMTERWNSPFADNDIIVPGGDDSIRNLIIREIRRDLTQRFQPEVCTVALNRIDSGVAELHHAVIKLGQMTVSGLVDPSGGDAESWMVPYTLVVQPLSLDPSHAAEALQRGVANLDRSGVEASLRLSAQEFLVGRTMAELDALNYGARDADRARQSIKDEMEDWINRHLVRHYGFRVRLEAITTRPSEADAADRAIRSLSDWERLATVRRLKRQIDGEAASDEGADRFDARHMETIRADILANPRLTAEDQTRYRRDLQWLEEAERRTGTRRTDLRAESRGRIAGGAPVRPSLDTPPSVGPTTTPDPAGSPVDPPTRAADPAPPPVVPTDDDILPPERV